MSHQLTGRAPAHLGRIQRLPDIVGALRDVGCDDVILIENEDCTPEAKAAIAETADTLRFAIAESARRRADLKA